MKLKTTLLAAAATLTIAPAANAYEGLYGAIGAGLSYFGYENDVSNDHPDGSGPFAFDSDSDYENGIGIFAAAGYDHGNNWRTELEYSYRTADIDQIDPQVGFSGIGAGDLSGETKIHALMGNVLYDFDVPGVVTPYLGGGIGMARVNHTVSGTNSATGLSLAYGDRAYNFAYQGIAGMAFELAEGLALDLSYRYFGMLGQSYDGALLNGLPAEVKAEANSHNLFAALRWNFGPSEPEAAPITYKDCWDGSSVPMTAECPPQPQEDLFTDREPVELTIYFGYDKSNLTAQASSQIATVAADALQSDIETVVVSGNTDTAGSSAYNQALSERRARVVRDALIANGVPAEMIRTEAYGESNLAKPTPDGTREPLNRRSEVVITFE